MDESYFDGPLLVSRLALIIGCAKILPIAGLNAVRKKVEAKDCLVKISDLSQPAADRLHFAPSIFFGTKG